MRRILIVTASVLLVAVLAIGVSPAMAGKPSSGGVFNGNGFPSGLHYNLIIHGKKSDFNCPAPKYYWECTDSLVTDLFETSDECNSNCVDPYVCDDTGPQIYGNVINVPFDNVDEEDNIIDPPISILIESGRKGPKNAPEGFDTLQVTDWCTESFPDEGTGDVDGAIFRLPKNDEGYAVYVKITGRPGEDTKAIFPFPDFQYVEDEAGNNLILLGALIESEITKINDEIITVFRSKKNANGNGNKVPKATELTRLFMWSGTVCYFDTCGEYEGETCVFDYCTDLPGPACEPYDLCCESENMGVYEGCTLKVEDVCPEGNVETTVDCKEIDEEQWVFNIADFVGMLWEIGNNNSYNIQIRFYPLPLNSEIQ